MSDIVNLSWNEQSSFTYADVMGMSRLERKLLGDAIEKLMQERKTRQSRETKASAMRNRGRRGRNR